MHVAVLVVDSQTLSFARPVSLLLATLWHARPLPIADSTYDCQAHQAHGLYHAKFITLARVAYLVSASVGTRTPSVGAELTVAAGGLH